MGLHAYFREAIEAIPAILEDQQSADRVPNFTTRGLAALYGLSKRC